MFWNRIFYKVGFNRIIEKNLKNGNYAHFIELNLNCDTSMLKIGR